METFRCLSLFIKSLISEKSILSIKNSIRHTARIKVSFLQFDLKQRQRPTLIYTLKNIFLVLGTLCSFCFPVITVSQGQQHLNRAVFHLEQHSRLIFLIPLTRQSEKNSVLSTADRSFVLTTAHVWLFNVPFVCTLYVQLHENACKIPHSLKNRLFWL